MNWESWQWKWKGTDVRDFKQISFVGLIAWAADQRHVSKDVLGYAAITNDS